MWAWFKRIIGDGILERTYLLKRIQFQWKCPICKEVIVERMDWKNLIQLLQLIESMGIDNLISRDCPNGHHNTISFCDYGSGIMFAGRISPEESKKCLSDGFQWKCAICGEEMRRNHSKEILLRSSSSITETCKKGHHNRIFLFRDDTNEVYGDVALESLFWL